MIGLTGNYIIYIVETMGEVYENECADEMSVSMYFEREKFPGHDCVSLLVRLRPLLWLLSI